jgi:hypothetical protein
MGLLNRIARGFASEGPSCRVPRQSVFHGWMQRLASHFNAQLRFGGDGDAELTMRVRGEDRAVVVLLRDGVVHVVAPSNIKFASGELPGDVAEFLAERNSKLDYGDWDAIDNGRRAYFTLKASGRMDSIDAGAIKAVIDKMLAESIALDVTLQEQGYVR